MCVPASHLCTAQDVVLGWPHTAIAFECFEPQQKGVATCLQNCETTRTLHVIEESILPQRDMIHVLANHGNPGACPSVICLVNAILADHIVWTLANYHNKGIEQADSFSRPWLSDVQASYPHKTRASPAEVL